MFGFDDLGIPGDEEKKRKKKAINPLTPATTGGGVEPATGLKRDSGGTGASTLGGSTLRPLTTVKDADLLNRLKPKKKPATSPGLGEVTTPPLSKTADSTRSLTQQPPVRRDALQPQNPTAPSRQTTPQTLRDEDITVPGGVHNPDLYRDLHRDLGWLNQGADGGEDALSFETDESKLPPELSTSPEVIRANDPSVSKNDAYSISMRNKIQLDINKMRQGQRLGQNESLDSDGVPDGAEISAGTDRGDAVEQGQTNNGNHAHQPQANRHANAPVIKMEQDRIQNILTDKPGKFIVKEDPDASKGEEYRKLYEFAGLGNHAVNKHNALIEEMSRKHGVDPDLVRSLMWTENARGHYGPANKAADMLQKSNTPLPMNINKRLWSKLIGKDPEEMYDPRNNIEAATILAKRYWDRIEDPTPGKLGSVWIAGGREQEHYHGHVVQRAYQEKPWERHQADQEKVRKDHQQYFDDPGLFW